MIKLAKDLTAPYVDDIYKVRAIFKWITENIVYDFRFINRGGEINRPECESDIDCMPMLREWETNYIKKILRTKKAIADGYSKLFKRLCDVSRIQCHVVEGYARTRPYQIGNRLSVNHYWNAVIIDTAWYFVDATWAAGYCPEDDETGMLLKYVKNYQNYYWLTPFDKLSRNHYPKNGPWAEQHHLTKEQFFNKPHYYSTDILQNISNESPATGVLHVQKGDTIHFRFDYTRNINLLQINSNIFRNPSLWTTEQISKRKTKIVIDEWAAKKQVYIPFKRNGNRYEFDYTVNENSLYYIELIFDYRQAIRYRVRVED